MLKRTFKGGIHPDYAKDATAKKQILAFSPPKKVAIPLIQHTGTSCQPVVKVGDIVKTGTLIAKSEKLISANIHSSISGKIIAIKPWPHPVLGRSDAVVIESDGTDIKDELISAKGKDPGSISAEEIVSIVREAGIVGLGGAAFPTHVKLMPPKDKPVDTFILNGAECEPYLTCDDRVMQERADETLKGALLIMKAVGIKKGFVAIEDNKPEAIRAMRLALSHNPVTCSLQLVILATKYPQGSEKQLISAILKKDVPAGGLPFDVGCLVSNVQTAYSVYEAVYKAKPLYERVITVSGDAIKSPVNISVRIGTIASDILEDLGGLSRPLAKLIYGGPMMGISQYTHDIPVIKGTSGILFLSEEAALKYKEGVCIRCARCLKVCPIRLAPTTLMNYIKKEMFDDAEQAGVMNCFECAGCAYECPARIPLLDYMKFGKAVCSRKNF